MHKIGGNFDDFIFPKLKIFDCLSMEKIDIDIINIIHTIF